MYLLIFEESLLYLVVTLHLHVGSITYTLYSSKRRLFSPGKCDIVLW